MKNNIDINELEKFSKIANEWWKPNGKFKILHKFNPIRVKYIIEQILKIRKLDSVDDIEGLTILDVGCGGGLISEAFSNLGAKVTAIDPVEKNIMIAKAHQLSSESSVEYKCTTIDKLTKDQTFDIVLCLEVIEHVVNPEVFLEYSSKLLNPNGLLFIATINRTLESLLLAKFTAEYILNWIPKGTHNWNKFLKPSEINALLAQTSLGKKKEKLKLNDISGFTYNILNNNWNITNNLRQNYIMCYGAQ